MEIDLLQILKESMKNASANGANRRIQSKNKFTKKSNSKQFRLAGARQKAAYQRSKNSSVNG